jgi:N-terminal domain of (some) glycogen debranching enzymes
LDDVIRVEDQYYILATSSLADDRTRVLKHGETFGVFDRYGDIQPLGLGEQGLYHDGARFLSRQMLGLGRDRPLLLSSTVKDDNALLRFCKRFGSRTSASGRGRSICCSSVAVLT